MNPIKPFIKWVGGKTQIIGDVIRLFPREMNNYHEPFLGGGSVLLALLSNKQSTSILSHRQSGTIKVNGTIYASDLNANLIALYQNIQTRPEDLITEVGGLVEEFSDCTTAGGTEVNRKALTAEEAMTSPESYYFWIRGRFNALTGEDRTTPTASAMLLFMNKTCFRGLYREGPHGFNVPFGNYKNPTVLDAAHIRAVSDLIQCVVFSVSSFDESLTRPEAGDFVYLDPPYAPETEKSVVGYTADGFGLDAHARLFETCGIMNINNVKLLMSNADVDLVKDAFPSPAYTTEIISCRRAINSKKPGGRTNEVLIRN
jgi:DNA adenine methylase